MSDELLAVVMEVVYNLDLKIPDDLAVVCISDGKLPYYLKPKITHIHHSGFEVGKKAAAMLLEQLRHKNKPLVKEIMVETRLVKLGSV